jgi:hypothetical protein
MRYKVQIQIQITGKFTAYRFSVKCLPIIIKKRTCNMKDLTPNRVHCWEKALETIIVLNHDVVVCRVAKLTEMGFLSSLK